MFGNKGLLFILDLILISSVIIFVFIFAINFDEKKMTKTQSDLTFDEAKYFLSGENANQTSDEKYVCRDFNNIVLGASRTEYKKIIENRVCAKLIG